jgi:aminobenzoyl-glutamate utilization protein B
MNDELRRKVAEAIDEHGPGIIDTADQIHKRPEIGFQERFASQLLAERLQANGFAVEKPIGGLETAFRATKRGKGPGPTIAVLAEYDALPAIGHGCGHNLIAASGLGAAIGLGQVMDQLDGTFQIIGTPAEEGGGGKVILAEAGVFDGVDASLMIHHAGPYTGSSTEYPGGTCLAVSHYSFTFHGKPAHAAGDPYNGANALNGVIKLFTGTDAIRQHVRTDARIHGIISHGGDAPNVVPHRAEARFYIRAGDRAYLEVLERKVMQIAEGAALMTETKVEAKVVSGVSNLLGNGPMERAMQANLDRLGPPPFDDADRAKAAEFQATLSDEDITASWRRIGLPVRKGVSLCDVAVPLEVKGAPMMGSTDVGDVSWVVPTVQARGAVYAIGTPGHSWQLTAQGMLPAAHKGMVHVAKVMAGTAVDAIRDPELVAAAKADLAARTAGTPYEPVLSPDVQPPFDMSKGAA